MREATSVLALQEQTALRHLRSEMATIANVIAVIFFGYVARGEATDGSDLDVLAVIDRELSYTEETAAYDAVYRNNLRYDTHISLVVVDAARWESLI